jgi:hypothetical protein
MLRNSLLSCHSAFDSGAGLVEQHRKEAGSVLGVRAVWYDWDYAALTARRTDGRGVTTLVGENSPSSAGVVRAMAGSDHS